MKNELLKEGMKCRITHRVDDSEGALYADEVVKVVDWSTVTKSNIDSSYIVFVIDEIGKHHTVGLRDIEPL